MSGLGRFGASIVGYLASAVLGISLVACRQGEPQRVHRVGTTGPELLHDEEETRAYVEAFPIDSYTVHEVPRIGRFYIDHARDRIKKAIVEGRVWEEHVVALLEQHLKPGDVVIDVGAHVGVHTLKMSKLVGPKGRVYAFEPVRKIYSELTHNLRLNGADNVIPLRFALGAGPPKLIEMDPLVEKGESGAHVGAGGDAVELRSLDSFGFEGVSLIKIDVEGFELPVLDGAKETIRRNRPLLIVEIMGGFHYEHAPPKVQVQIDVTKWEIQGMGYTVERVGHHDYLGTPKD